MSKTSWLVAAGVACSVILTSPAQGETDPRLKEFAKQKRQETEQLAAKLHLDVPPEARAFFKAAEAGDWISVSNRFGRIWRPTEQHPLRGLDNAMYVPIRDTFMAYEQFQGWDEILRQKFADSILSSMPAGSVYFGGTNPGRYFPAVIHDRANSPDIFLVSQTDLPTSFYPDYVRLTYGSCLRIPTEKDVNQALCRSGDEVRSAGPLTMELNFLTKAIFEYNRDKHEVYVEESFVIPWMYPYLEPHGLIMKLNIAPLTQLDPSIVARDRQYWGALTKELLSTPTFLSNEQARTAYAKLRSAIAGLYAYRGLTNEAEAVFKQALELGPSSLEANLRLAQLYRDNGRFDDAIAILEQLEGRLGGADPWKQKTAEAIAQFREMKRKGGEEQHDASPPAQSK
jgi:hypothetical protein